jgi:predicted ribosomally synthesized six-cysteine peptide SCIFF
VLLFIKFTFIGYFKLKKIVHYVTLYQVRLECFKEDFKMKHVKTLTTKTLKNTMAKGGCGECQTSCQSACKTSCTVGNQSCENNK